MTTRFCLYSKAIFIDTKKAHEIMPRFTSIFSLTRRGPHSPIYLFLFYRRQLVSRLGLNVFYSVIAYTENNWVRRKVRQYPLQMSFMSSF